MTWNVQTAEHDPREWASVVAQLRPDVLGLQEVCRGEADELAELLRRDHGLAYSVVPGPIRPPTPAEANAPINAALGPACDTGPEDVEFGLAVLSRLPVSSPSVTTFPPDRRDEQRGYMTVRVTPGSGLAITVHNTHVGLDGVQADQIRRLAADAVRADPAVVVGDLNVPVRAPELAPMRRAFAEVDPAGRYPTTFEKIDYIFARGLDVLDAPETPGVTSSDHRPLLATLRVRG